MSVRVVPAIIDGGRWSACFGLSWADMLLYDQAGPQQMICEGGMFLRKSAGTMGVAAARSEIVKNFLEVSDAEFLFMVDTDMGFRPDTVARLVAAALEHDAPVVGGLAFALKSARKPETELHAARYRMVPTLYRFADIGGEKGFLPLEDYTRDAFQPVDATGAACLLMRRDALQVVGVDPFRPILVADALPDGGSREFSEDLSFCVRLANAGIPIAVDSRVKTTHHKGGLYLDEETYGLQEATRRASPLGLAADRPHAFLREVAA